MKYQAKFLTPTKVEYFRANLWKLSDVLKFRDSHGDVHVVPAGFVTDFASIPSLARIGAVIMLLGLLLCFLSLILGGSIFALGFAIAWLDPLLNGDDNLDGPATVHDDGYNRCRLGNSAWVMKFYWDWVLFDAMRAVGEPLWKCGLIWFNVSAFGWLAWYSDGRKHRHNNTETYD